MGPVWTQELHELQLTGGGKEHPICGQHLMLPASGGWVQGAQGGAQALGGSWGPSAPTAQPGKGPGAPRKTSFDALSSGGRWTVGWGPWRACGRVLEWGNRGYILTQVSFTHGDE